MTVKEFVSASYARRQELIPKQFKAVEEDDYKLVFWRWLNLFHKKYMVEQMDESNLSDIQKDLFLVPWNNCREKLAPDIEGNMVKSILKTDQVLKVERGPEAHHLQSRGVGYE